MGEHHVHDMVKKMNGENIGGREVSFLEKEGDDLFWRIWFFKNEAFRPGAYEVYAIFLSQFFDATLMKVGNAASCYLSTDLAGGVKQWFFDFERRHIIMGYYNIRQKDHLV